MDGGFQLHRRFPHGPATAFLAVVALAAAEARTSAADGEAKPLVIVVDGAGDLRGCSTGLAKAFPDGKDVELSPFNWSHGHRRIVVDQTDFNHARQQGEKLADAIRERQLKEPGRRIVVVAHSAGAAVGLAAAEWLPAKSLDRLILLAPSVSTNYDPKLAAKGCKEGIDAFCSSKDVWALNVGMKIVGTIDDPKTSQAAGRVGFKGIEANDPNIRQHFWTKEMATTGNNGGHYGDYAPDFAKKYLLPLMLPAETQTTQYRPNTSLDRR